MKARARSALTNSVYVTLLRIDQGTGRRFDSDVKKRANENLWPKKDNWQKHERAKFVSICHCWRSFLKLTRLYASSLFIQMLIRTREKERELESLYNSTGTRTSHLLGVQRKEISPCKCRMQKNQNVCDEGQIRFTSYCVWQRPMVFHTDVQYYAVKYWPSQVPVYSANIGGHVSTLAVINRPEID